MKTNFISICIVAVSLNFTLNAQTVWGGPRITFAKANRADWNLPVNQDRITDNVALTRKGSEALFNIIKETHAGNSGSSSNPAPADTEWAYGTTENYASLTYQSLPALIGSNNFKNIADNRNMVLHLITDDIYIDIKFLSWTSLLNGGGFSYERSTSISDAFMINEIFADPLNTSDGDANGDGTGSLLQDEFIELYNTTETAIDLTGWKLADADQDRHIFPEGTIIPAKGSLVVFGGGTPTNVPGVVQTATTGSLSLGDDSDTVTLKDASDTVIKTITYGAEAGDDQSIAKNPDFTGDFVKHTSITTNAVRFSPGRDNTDASVLVFIKNVNHFVTTWNTEADGVGNTSITLPIVTGAYDVDTNNDGTFDRLNLTSIQTLDLGSAGIHTIAIRPNSTNTKNELQIQFASGNNPGKLTTIENWGTIVWTSMNKAFEGCTRIRISPVAGVPNLNRVTDMSSMFKGAGNFTGNLSAWDVSNVTRMDSMFSNTESFSDNLSTWDVSNVTRMDRMFSGAVRFHSDLSWNVANVTNMDAMFYRALNFNGDISTWNVAKVTNMREMFDGAENFNQDISDWNVANVINMSGMFNGAANFNGDLSMWDVGKVCCMTNMLVNTTSFSRQNYEKLLSGWSERTLQNRSRVTFTAPSVSYCFGKAARNILTGTYGWRITGDSLDSDCLDLSIAADALLQGPYNSTAALMNDDLRTADRIPLTSPYSSRTSVTGTGIFDNTDDGDDIVDWVQIELRNSSDITEVLTTASALIQRDGDIVAPDGTSDVTISGTGGDYYVSVNHRNHIAASTTAALTLSATATAIDFTVAANVTGGTNAMAEVSSGKYALFAGDADGNNQVQTGDYNVAATRIGQSGYFRSDTDMNGEVQITDLNLFIATAIGNGIQF